MWKKYVGGVALVWFLTAGGHPVWTPVQAVAAGLGKEPVKPSCDISKTTICTIELWLAHKQKKRQKEIRQTLKDRSVKVLRRTIQFWRPRGGHPPANIAIGRGLNAVDARWVIDLALKYNDAVSMLVQQRLNPPNYVAIATSAWDENSQISISPEDLERLRDPALTTQQFHALYVELTGEKDLPSPYY